MAPADAFNHTWNLIGALATFDPKWALEVVDRQPESEYKPGLTRIMLDFALAGDADYWQVALRQVGLVFSDKAE